MPLELDGRPRHQVAVFRTTAPVRPAPITRAVSCAGSWTMPAIVSATACPMSSGPSTLKTRRHRGPGRADA